MCQVGDRILIDGQAATVRYVGTLEVWGSALAYGVEWDSSERGKNSGNVGPTFYFHTKVPGAGSFIKADSNKIVKRTNFCDALVESYGKEDNQITQEIKFGSKVVQNLGFEKLNDINSNFDQLMSVTLDKMAIHMAGPGILLPNLVKLDVSFNLFNRISEIWSIIDRVPQLQELNLNGNRFDSIKENLQIHGLKVLKLSATKMSMENVGKILKKFPKLKEITLASNDYHDEDITYEFQEFDFVDLSFNNLTFVPNLGATSLDASNNQIRSLKDTYQMKILDIRNNQIVSWSFIDSMYDTARLSELKITGNPLLASMNDEDIFLHLIARLECSKINGTLIRPEERQNAELYLISQVLKQEAQITSRKWQYLVETYNVQQAQHRPEAGNGLNDLKLPLRVMLDEQEIVCRTFLKDNTVLRLKGVISKHLQKSILDFQVFFYLNDTEEFLNDDIARLSELGLASYQNLYIRINP